MSKGMWLKIVASIVGLAALCILLWFATPLLNFGGSRPFDNPATRLISMGLISVSVMTGMFYSIRSRIQSAAEIAKSLSSKDKEEKDAEQDDSATLQSRMGDALATLKKASSTKGDYLYDIPWYVIIGPPGSGKTTALINSGLKFPLSHGGATPAAIAGVGGTRYCDWWFTEDAVLIDTAGRYTTQDSDTKGDKKSWLSFLDILKKNRPKQPINGVFICISIEDILSLPAAEVRSHADAIRSRLIELHDSLKVDFPVYALFTKADLISGFMEFFGHLNEADRQVVWGATFQTNDKTANMVVTIPQEFDLLIERLNQELIDRIQDEPTPTTRVQLFGFPSQVSALKQPVFDFLNWIFEPTRYHSNATLRGFYFTSGTQQGTPIDQLIGAISRSFGTQDVGTAQYSGLGKSFFLTDMLEKVVFEESGWVSTNVKAVRRALTIKTLSYLTLVLLSFGAAGLWWTSYTRNTDLIAKSYLSLTKYKTDSAALRDETMISDNDFRRIIQPLYDLRNLPAGYASQEKIVPVLETFGLSQTPRLNAAAESAYDTGLQRLFRPRLMFKIEELMRKNITNPGVLTEILKIYFMVAGKEPSDKARVISWWQKEWSEMFPGLSNVAGRQALSEHLSRLMDIDAPDGISAIDVDQALVQEVQNAIGRMTVADRAFEILRSNARQQSARDWIAQRKGGQDISLVFEATNGADLNSVRIPFFYTYAGFHETFLSKLAEVTEQVGKERQLLGSVAAQTALKAQYETLQQVLLERYSKEFIVSWQSELKKLRIKSLTADKPRYVALQAAAAPTSPITQLIESIKDETTLTKEKPAANSSPAQQPNSAPQIVLPKGEIPGATVESAFRAYQLLVEGDRTRRPVDETVKVLNDIYQALSMLNDPVRAAQGRQQFSENLRTLEATAVRYPDPFKAMIQSAAASFSSDATGSTLARIQQAVSEQITGACQQAIAGVYPFTRNSSKDISIQDFQNMFGPNGVLDRFFSTNLAQYVNTSASSWVWNQANPVARQLSPAMLQSFQRANEIKQAFFPSNSVGFNFAVKNIGIGDGIDMARLEINSGQLVTERPKPVLPPAPTPFSFFGSPPPPPAPVPQIPQPVPVVTFQWPGPVAMGGASINIAPDVSGKSSILQKTGVWGIFKLLDTVSVSPSGQALIARVSVGGREVQYQINAVTLPNPFTIPSLRNFSCPVSR